MRGIALLLLAGACAPREEAPSADMTQSLSVSAGTLAFGESFLIEAERIARAGLATDPWPEEPFADLRARPAGAERRQRGGWVRETRRWEARAYSLEPELALMLPEWRGRSPDGAAVAAATQASLRITPAVDHARPGAWELPAELALPRRPSALLAAAAAVAVLAAAFGLRRAFRRRPEPAPAPPADAGAESAALRSLRGLRVALVAGGLDDRAFHERLAESLRLAAAERGVGRAEARTSEELIAGWPQAAEALTALLPGCDAVKFARARTVPATRAERLERAERLLEETP